MPTAADIEGLAASGDVFRFKLFDGERHLVFVSDEITNPHDMSADGANEHAATVIAAGEPVVEVGDGRNKPDRPDVHVEAYVPLFARSTWPASPTGGDEAPQAVLTKPGIRSDPFDRIVECLSVPVAAGVEGIALPAAAGDGAPSILVAEDNEVNQLVIGALHEKLGVPVRYAANGSEAVDMRRLEDPAVILMDVSMPVMSGLDATVAIRAWEADADCRPVHIIDLTAHAFEGDRQRCLAAGMGACMTKPVSMTRLAQELSASGRVGLRGSEVAA